MPEQKEHAALFAEMAREDAVTKIELWKQNQNLHRQVVALRAGHKALVKALEKCKRHALEAQMSRSKAAQAVSLYSIFASARNALTEAKKLTE